MDLDFVQQVICVVLVHRDKKGQEIILTVIMVAMTVIAMGILYILSFFRFDKNLLF